MKKIILTSFLCFLVNQLMAQKSFEKALGSFLSGIKVSKSFTTKDDAAEAAAISLTMPKNAASSYLIDLAVKHSLFGNIGITGELHRNNLVAKEQKNYSLGLVGNFVTNKAFETTSSHTGFITLSTKYSRDQVANTGSLVADFNYTIVYAAGMVNSRWLPNHFNEFGEDFALIYQPSIGAQYQNTINASKDSLKGNIIRPYLTFNFQLFPLRKLLKSNLDLFSNITYRYDLVKTVMDNNSKSHPLWSYGTEYIFWQAVNDKGSVEQAAKLSFSYNTGDDPSNGLEKQQYWLLCLKFNL